MGKKRRDEYYDNESDSMSNSDSDGFGTGSGSGSESSRRRPKSKSRRPVGKGKPLLSLGRPGNPFTVRSEAWALQNSKTGCYLAAHEDGEVICEDDDLMHHDIPWFATPSSQTAKDSFKLSCCINKLNLCVEKDSVRASATSRNTEFMFLPVTGVQNKRFAIQNKQSKMFLGVSEDGEVVNSFEAESEFFIWTVSATKVPPARVPKNAAPMNESKTNSFMGHFSHNNTNAARNEVGKLENNAGQRSMPVSSRPQEQGCCSCFSSDPIPVQTNNYNNRH